MRSECQSASGYGQKPGFSVIIPAYQAEGTILMCLESLFSQKAPLPFEVIVVNSSQDETARLVEKNYPQVRLIQLPQRVDQGTARNVGLEKARGELICFIDADCQAQPGWFACMYAGIEKGYDMVGGPVVNGNPGRAISWAGYLLEFNDLLPPTEATPPYAVGHLPSGNVCYRREVLERYGGFPAGLKFALEDLLFHWHISREGVRMLFDPRIRVLHYHRTSLKDYLRHQYKLGRGTVYLLRRTRMEGWWLVRHPWICTPLLPLIPVVKFLRTCGRYFAWDRAGFFRRPAVFPFMLLGLAFWGAGFAGELYHREE